jgi:hypothetical protein
MIVHVSLCEHAGCQGQSPNGQLAEAMGRSVECRAQTAVIMALERLPRLLVQGITRESKDPQAVDDKNKGKVPATVHKNAPEQELEHELRNNPHDLDKKADVGSDESMDASDPPAAAQPGQSDEPVPSSGFPE